MLNKNKNKNKNKKVSVVGVVGVPACYGGFESLVQNLIDYKSDNIDYHVFCSSGSYDIKIKTYKKAELTYIPLKANGGSSIIYDITCLLISLFKRPDTVLILGVSGCVFLPIFKFFSRSNIITNIDGLEWRRGKWGAGVRAFLKFSEKLAVKYSDVVISDNEAISKYVYQEYGKQSHVIAYGGDHALQAIQVEDECNGDYYFSVCRIEPENNIMMILKAFCKTVAKIKIIGNWNASAYGRDLKEKYGQYSNIELIDPVYNIDILFKLRSQCLGFIHGHSAGGTNPSLVEAMHFKKPIFAFDCDFNRFSTNNSAYYFNSDIELLSLISEPYNEKTLAKYAECAEKMKEIAMTQYTWVEITRLYEELY